MRRTLLASAVVACIWTSVTFAGSSPDCLAVVQRYADTLIERARDNYGPQKSPLLLSALDRKTLAPLTTQPTAPEGVRRGDRVASRTMPLVGCNPMHDENLLRTLYTLGEITGDAKYRQAADDELRWFLMHAASPQTHLLGWGEHLFWDPLTDEVRSEHADPVHEFARPWVLWNQCYSLAPQPCKDFAVGLWEHQVVDHKSGAFDRHALFFKHGPTDGMDFARHASFYIGTWTAAYKQTGDKVFLKAIEVLLARFEGKRHPTTGWISVVGGEPTSAPAQTLPLAIECAAAAEIVPDPLRSRLKAFTEREDALFLALPHEPREKGFVIKVDRNTGQPSTIAKWGDTWSPKWHSQYGGSPTAQVALLCIERYGHSGSEKYKQLVCAAADSYLDSLPADTEDTWPELFGHVITVELAAARWTGHDKYTARANELAGKAIALFWGDSPLPKASAKTEHYESITGADSLALALLELHVTTNKLPVRMPANTIDR